MKNMYLIIVLIITMAFLLIPLLATEKSGSDSASVSERTSTFDEKTTSKSKELEKLNEIKVYLNNEKKTVTLNKEEYILGVVAAEMSAENSVEALKAQALAAYTYAYRKHLQNTNNEYDLTNDSTLDQGYLNEEERKNKWGDKFAEYESKLKQAVAEIENELIVYEGEPILAAYHEISAGKTETAKNVWGTDYPYLQSENSIGDLLSPNFFSEVSVTVEDFTKKITDLGGTAEGEAAKFIGENKKSEAGTVLSIELCGVNFTGAQIREAFDLKSAAFDIVFKNKNFVFSVSGYGHGVGMSQFGANYMAQQGSDYKEIINAYYRGVQIITLK